MLLQLAAFAILIAPVVLLVSRHGWRRLLRDESTGRPLAQGILGILLLVAYIALLSATSGLAKLNEQRALFSLYVFPSIGFFLVLAPQRVTRPLGSFTNDSAPDFFWVPRLMGWALLLMTAIRVFR